MPDDTHSDGARATQTHRFRLGDDDGTVTVQKRVSKGERLEIDTGTDSVALDALLLEGLTWQRDRGAVDDLLGDGTAIASDPVGTDEVETDAAVAGADTTEPTKTISVSNEYSHVQVRPVHTDTGDGIVVTTPGRGTSITLGVQSLRELAAVEDTYVFSVWFETPFGPEDTPVEGPL